MIGDAARVLGSWQLTDANYEPAWKRMNEVYNDDYQIIQAHLEKLFSMPKMNSETYLGIRALIDTTNETVRSLGVLNVPVDNWDTIIVYMITSRLYYTTLDAWEMHRDVKVLPSLATLFTFLERRARALSNTQGSSGMQIEKYKEKVSAKPRASTYDETSQSLNCKVCREQHQLYRCPIFLKLGLEDRTQKVKDLRLCFNCLKSGHSAYVCASGACKKCPDNKRHNSVLCKNHSANQRASSSSSTLLAIEPAPSVRKQ